MHGFACKNVWNNVRMKSSNFNKQVIPIFIIIYKVVINIDNFYSQNLHNFKEFNISVYNFINALNYF